MIRHFATMALLCAGAVGMGCATAGDPVTEPEPINPAPELTADTATLGEALRRFGEEGGRGIVLMKGLEDRPGTLPRDRKPESVAHHLAKQANCAVQELPGYYFLYPTEEPYDVLAAFSLEGRLDPAYDDAEAAISFGSGTRLFGALAMLGEATGHTFVADNSLAELQVGELVLDRLPLERALEALLKSARIARPNVDSTDEYIFISGQVNRNPRSLLLNADGLTAEQRALLDKRVDVYLPQRPREGARLMLGVAAAPLGRTVSSLSRQLGVNIEVERGLEKLPVNPSVFRNVRVETALDLIVRQWLEPVFGYEVTPDLRIRIRTRPPRTDDVNSSSGRAAVPGFPGSVTGFAE